MYKITVDWYENYCQVNLKSDFFDDLYCTMWEGYSKDDVEGSIYIQLSNLHTNHYGKFEDQTEVIHKYLI